MIAITGAAGFIGARLAEHISLQGEPTLSIDKRTHFLTRPEHRGIAFGQIVDRDDFLKSVTVAAKSTPFKNLRAIFHMGACSDTTEKNWDYLRKVNVEYSQALWNFCSQNKIPFIYASSAATYGAGEQGYSDDEKKIAELKPLNLYGKSKQEFDQWVLEQEKRGNAPPQWAGLKFFNVYGFGERHKENMASMALKAYDQIRFTDGVQLFRSHRADIGDGEQSRDFICVEDVVRMIDFCWRDPIQRGIYNVGTGQAQSFLTLVRAMFTALGKPEHIEYVDTPADLRNQYQYFTQAEMTKLQNAGYDRPPLSITEGVARMVARLKQLE